MFPRPWTHGTETWESAYIEGKFEDYETAIRDPVGGYDAMDMPHLSIITVILVNITSTVSLIELTKGCLCDSTQGKPAKMTMRAKEIEK